MKCRSRGGLLLEVLLGLGIFATAILLAFGVFPNSRRAAVQSRNYTVANAIARDYLERELAKDFASITSYGPLPEERYVTMDGRDITLPFDVEMVVTPITTTPIERSNVKCVVGWQDGEQRKEVFYETWVTNF